MTLIVISESGTDIGKYTILRCRLNFKDLTKTYAVCPHCLLKYAASLSVKRQIILITTTKQWCLAIFVRCDQNQFFAAYKKGSAY